MRSLRPSDVTVIAGVKVTTPTRTLIDLAAVVSTDRLEAALDDALRRGLTSLRKLEAALRSPGAPRRGIATLARLLAGRSPGRVPESALERRLAALLVRSGLPKPVAQYEVREGSRVVARVDLAYPGFKLALEADGYAFHADRSAWERDRLRDNDLVGLGWTVLRFTKEQMQSQPVRVVAQVRRVLARR